MLIPSEIMIAEHLIKVFLKHDGGLTCAGEWNSWHQEIRVNNDGGKPESTQAEVFLHEIFEAINNMFDLQLDHKTITLLSELVFQVIRRNKLDFVNP